MDNIRLIRPTIGMSRLEQLAAFVAFEAEKIPEKTHIAAWALEEIERLQALVAELEQRVDPVTWPMRGVRVDGDTVIVSVFGGNKAARQFCGTLVALIDAAPSPSNPQITKGIGPAPKEE